MDSIGLPLIVLLCAMFFLAVISKANYPSPRPRVIRATRAFERYEQLLGRASPPLSDRQIDEATQRDLAALLEDGRRLRGDGQRLLEEMHRAFPSPLLEPGLFDAVFPIDFDAANLGTFAEKDAAPAPEVQEPKKEGGVDVTVPERKLDRRKKSV